MGVWPNAQVLKHAATVAWCVTLGVLAFGQEACLSALGGRECAGNPECVGEAKLRECNGGEGYSHWSERDCPSETRCISTPHGARCAAASEGKRARPTGVAFPRIAAKTGFAEGRRRRKRRVADVRLMSRSPRTGPRS